MLKKKLNERQRPQRNSPSPRPSSLIDWIFSNFPSCHHTRAMEAGLVFWPAEWQHMLIYWFRKQLENSCWWWVCLVDPNKRVCVVSEDERLGPRPQGLCRPACLKIWFFENHIFFKLLWLPIHGVCGACCAHPQSPPWYHGGVDASLWYFGEIQMAQWHQRELLCQWVRLLLISWTF